jgi:hypothetical protein
MRIRLWVRCDIIVGDHAQLISNNSDIHLVPNFDKREAQTRIKLPLFKIIPLKFFTFCLWNESERTENLPLIGFSHADFLHSVCGTR